MAEDPDYIETNKGGVPNFPDTFFGPKDKAYMDRLARDLIKIRGVNFRYYVKTDTPTKTDGDKPGSTNKDLSPFAVKGRVSSSALYGESLNIGQRIDSTKREISPAWGYAPPVEFRGVAFNPVQSDTPDERGHFETRKLTVNVARSMCEDINIVPDIGDVIEMPTLLNGFYDVELVKSDSHKFGGTGFFTAYELNLSRSTKFLPQRKELPGAQI